MSEPEAPQTESVDVTKLPEVRYMKSNSFRVIHCDGAVGALTPRRFLGVSLYSERVGLPDRSLLEADEDGNVIETLIVGNREIVREIEATVMLRVEAAESLANWLLARIKEARGEQE